MHPLIKDKLANQKPSKFTEQLNTSIYAFMQKPQCIALGGTD